MFVLVILLGPAIAYHIIFDFLVTVIIAYARQLVLTCASRASCGRSLMDLLHSVASAAHMKYSIGLLHVP